MGISATVICVLCPCLIIEPARQYMMFELALIGAHIVLVSDFLFHFFGFVLELGLIDSILLVHILYRVMDEYFMKRLDISLNELRERQLTYENLEDHNVEYGSGDNSPATLSNSSSSSGGSGCKFRKLTYNEVSRSFDQYDSAKYFNEMSILQTYFNGQKHLYTYSKNVTYRKLNMLVLPTLFLSTSGTIMVPFISHFEWSSGVISTIYAIITLLLGLVNYFRLESSYQQFSSLADRYDKLQTSLEFTNSKLVFIENSAELERSVATNIREFEDKLSDIVNVIVPEDVKRIFPVICNINIFSFMRKIDAHKRALIIQYKDVKNEIRYIYYKDKNKDRDMDKDKRLQSLLDTKERLRLEIIQYKDVYNSIDFEFVREIRMAEDKIKNWFWWLLFGASAEPINNPIIQKYLA
jgi:hypothetical protein